MAALHKSAASLRILGDSLKPDEISQILNCPPLLGYVKGQIERHKIRDIVRKTGAWILKAADKKPGDLDAQVTELLGRLNTDLSVWRSLAKQYRMDLFCGIFMKGIDEGFEVSPQTMKLLADRGIKLAVCLYAPMSRPNPTDPCPCNSGKTYAECCAPKPKS